MTLTVLCITRFGKHATPFLQALHEQASELDATFVLGADGTVPDWAPNTTHVIDLNSNGYIESVLDQAISACPDGHILRMDDDETINPAMLAWLSAGSYEDADHWAFPRLHLWPDEQHYITNPPLYPDLQTRLSVKAKAGGRSRIHQGSPHGTGRIAPVAIEHHKFLVRDLTERERLVEEYERLQPGAGQQFTVFSVPERYANELNVERIER